MKLLYGVASDRVILDTVSGHDLRVVEVTSIEDERGSHAFFNFFEIGVGELWPFGADDKSFRFVKAGIHVFGVGEVFVEVAKAFGCFHSFGIPSGNFGTFVHHVVGELDGDRLANIVCVLFEGETPEGDLLLLQNPEFFADTIKE